MLLSRVADALYWMSRYLERAEHTARVIDVRLDLGLDRRPTRDGWDFDRLYASLRLRRRCRRAGNAGGARRHALVFDPTNRESVVVCVTAARENARQVREEISSEMWEQINALFLRLQQARDEGTWSARPHYVSRLVIEGVHLFQGITDATMGHGEGWHYLQAGPLPRARRRDGGVLDVHFRDAGSSAAGRAHPSSGSACCARARRSRPTAATTPPTCGRSGSPSSCCSTRSFRARCGSRAARVESSLRAIAQLTGARRRRTRRAARRPAARVARLRTGRRDPRRGSARLSRGISRMRADPYARCIRATSGTRSSRRCRRERLRDSRCTTPSATSRRFTYDSPISESVMEARMQPRSDGAQRCLRFGLSTHADLARDDVPGPRRQRRPSLQHPGPARQADADRRSAGRMRRRLPDSLPERARCRRLGRARRAHRVGRVLGAAEPEPVRSIRRRCSTSWRARSALARGDDPLSTLRRLMDGDVRALRVQPAAARASTRRSTTRWRRGAASARTSRTS